MSSLQTSTEPKMTRRDVQRSPGRSRQWPEKPRPSAGSYLLLLVAALVLAAAPSAAQQEDAAFAKTRAAMVEEVQAYARSDEFRRSRQVDTRMMTGEPKAVVTGLLELKEQMQVDEIVIATPSLDRERRTASYRAIADAWRTRRATSTSRRSAVSIAM